jgi:hypothetical protein
MYPQKLHRRSRPRTHPDLQDWSLPEEDSPHGDPGECWLGLRQGRLAHGLFEKPIEVNSVFEQDECADVIAVTKGHGFEGVTHQWGT